MKPFRLVSFFLLILNLIFFLSHCGGTSSFSFETSCQGSEDCVAKSSSVLEDPDPIPQFRPKKPDPILCVPEVCDGKDNDCDKLIDEGLESCEYGVIKPPSLGGEINPNVATTTYAATAFLYTGPDAVQTGMDPDTIDPKRTAVIRGRVLNLQGEPLTGVTITLKDHPEYGQTLSRWDGWFDMVVNGGGQFTVEYERASYLSALRYAKPAWQEYVVLEEVVLLQLDPQVTEVDLNSPDIEVASGSLQSDADGDRQATLLFKPGTTAQAILPDGSTQPLSTLSLRVTEATVGELGPQAMPAPLPGTSAYTYAVSIDVEETFELGAAHVEFNQPVPFYVENFLGFPTGLKVPLGVLDETQAAWVAEPDGRVIEILSETGGLADLDITGDGLINDALDLAELGIDEAERERIAQLYEPGDTLWRVELNHFSWLDLNFPIDPIGSYEDPNQPDPELGNEDQEEDPCKSKGSIIECQNQVLGERIPIVGTPHTLNYRSNRVQGYEDNYSLHIPLSGDSIPPDLARIELDLSIAGQVFEYVFENEALNNLSVDFVWDGLDVYGQRLQGAQKVTATIKYAYPKYYAVPADAAASFGLACNGPPPAIPGLLSCQIPSTLNSRARQEIIKKQVWSSTLGGPPSQQDLLAWSLDIHHRYDPQAKVLYRGDGSQRSALSAGALVIRAFAGTGIIAPLVDGIPAIESSLNLPFNTAVAPDGSVYITDRYNHRIRRVDTDGIITTVAGNGNPTFAGDGGLAIDASLNQPTAIAFAPDASFYIADMMNLRIRRVGTDGIITTVVGDGNLGTSGDGGAANLAQIGQPFGLAVGPDGSLYIAHGGAYNMVRRVDPAGIITTVAGTGPTGYSGDGGLATDAQLYYPHALAFSPAGELYIVDRQNYSIRRVDAAGVISTVAGNGTSGYSGDGGLAIDAQLHNPSGLAFSPNGSFYISESTSGRVRRVDTEGIITTIAGNGLTSPYSEGSLAIEAPLDNPYGLSFAPDGTLYLAHFSNSNSRVSQISSPLPDFSVDDFIVASQDGRELYHFSGEGRHLETLDASQGSVLFSFAYDASGALISITDRNGQVTTIQRDAEGIATEIIAPFGQSTSLSVDANNYLETLTNPAGELYSFDYSEDGLLSFMTNPRGFEYQFDYDDQGRLILDTDPLGGFTQLIRTVFEDQDAFEVVKTTAMNRSTTYRIEDLPEGEVNRQWINTMPDGTESLSVFSPGLQVSQLPDGTEITQAQSPDSRFGMQAPLPERVVTLPSGLSQSMMVYEESALADPDDLLSLTSKTLSTCINGTGATCTGGRLSTSVYETATHQETLTSAEGRQVVRTYDGQGRLVSSQTAGLSSVQLAYNGQGQLESITMGDGSDDRVQSLSYNGDGYVETLTNPLSQTSILAYDLAGRITQVTLPDGEVLDTAYDANGNNTSLSPPGKAPHSFSYNALDLMDLYTPPLAGIDTGIIDPAYNLDRQTTQISRADGSAIVYSYDLAGRLDGISINRGNIIFGYNPGTGQLNLINAPEVDLSFNYDGALKTDLIWSGTINGEVNWTYNNYFEVATQSINGVDTVVFDYDNDGLVTQAGDLSLIHHPDHGLLTDSTLLNTSTSQTYNSFGELENFASVFDNGIPTNLYEEYIQARDNLGRITERQETVGGVTSNYVYQYHVRGWLEDVYQDGVHISHYSYDSNGNRLGYENPSLVGSQLSGAYDAQDRLESYGDYTYSYTANGELTNRQNNTTGNNTQYTYDELGNLINVTLEDGTLIEYVIDGQNRRVGKRVNGALSQGFLYQDQLNPVAELNPDGSVLSRFIYASKAHVPDTMMRGGETYRMISDHLGSVRLVVNANTGTIEQRIDYDEFGQVTQDTNPGFQPFGFAGGLYDPQTGLVRFGARDYDAQIGRWTAKDPILFEGGNNLYGYTFNDPINFIDVDGNIPLAAILPAIGGAINALASGYNAYQDCGDLGDILAAAGGGFIGGAIGTGTGLGVGSLIGSAALAGAIGSAVGNAVEQGVGSIFSGQSYSPGSTVAAAVVGAIGGSIASKAVPSVGRPPSLTTSRNSSNFGPNSKRLVGQEGISGGIGAGAGIAEESFLGDQGCPCR